MSGQTCRHSDGAYVKEAAALGVTYMDAKMMCANFRHQGGASAVKRILAKTAKPYTLDHLYAACQTDTGNQVGAYKSRQKMVYNALKTHITNYKVTAAEAIQAAIKIAKAEIGYLEKASKQRYLTIKQQMPVMEIIPNIGEMLLQNIRVLTGVPALSVGCL